MNASTTVRDSFVFTVPGTAKREYHWLKFGGVSFHDLHLAFQLICHHLHNHAACGCLNDCTDGICLSSVCSRFGTNKRRGSCFVERLSSKSFRRRTESLGSRRQSLACGDCGWLLVDRSGPLDWLASQGTPCLPVRPTTRNNLLLLYYLSSLSHFFLY